MTQYPASWSPRKQEKRAREAALFLHPGEAVLYQCPASGTRPLTSDAVVTDARVFTYVTTKFGWAVANTEITNVESSGNGAMGYAVVLTTAWGESFKLKGSKEEMTQLADSVKRVAGDEPPEDVARAMEQREAMEASARLPLAQRWPDATILGNPSKPAVAAIERLCHGEETPWLVMVPGIAQGVLVAFEDRLAIVKTGVITSLMAGSFMGERSTTFYFRDITAIEYNSGMVTGVLEVLTASYQGSANKDFWRGAFDSRNANSNAPYTLSNTLPLAKPEHKAWASHIQAVRARISGAKHAPVQVISAPVAASSLADELGKLVALRDAGALSNEEFAAAKAQLIGG